MKWLDNAWFNLIGVNPIIGAKVLADYNNGMSLSQLIKKYIPTPIADIMKNKHWSEE